jgi:dsDNA-specific endonuclease/ATPase MutS2
MPFISWLKSLFRQAPKLANAPAASSEDEDDVDPFNPFPEPVELPPSDVIDLHTISPRDVKRVVEEFLRLANEARFPVVRIIHGKGIGVQRELVRSVLARTAFVRDWTDAPPEAGGMGATIVRLL